MYDEATPDAAAQARHAHYGTLPERIRFEDMTTEVESAPDTRTHHAFNPEGAWNQYSCLALDLGL
ncbi:hypothetical protein [Streptomyces sp. WG-D5]